ncbi:DUF4893 domain-containing protein [Phenylobacterium sp.]|jgi:hypothetical protein|uniref:DUF4893 domain-containing protein n=1 Tax=Phenylobacterium sp. TaxID=1871053 RepID=UPI002F92558D
MLRVLILAVLAFVTAAAANAASASWRQDARPDDVRRLRQLDTAWGESLAAAPRAELRKLGRVLDPKPGLARPQPTPGAYQCRTIKLGPGMGVLPYGWFRCRVELTPGGDLILEKTTGSQRPFGHLYPDSRHRLVFLGAVAWGSTEGRAVYGVDPQRDQIGAFERIGANHYRLVLPYPRVESTLDVIELRR